MASIKPQQPQSCTAVYPAVRESYPGYSQVYTGRSHGFHIGCGRSRPFSSHRALFGAPTIAISIIISIVWRFPARLAPVSGRSLASLLTSPQRNRASPSFRGAPSRWFAKTYSGSVRVPFTWNVPFTTGAPIKGLRIQLLRAWVQVQARRSDKLLGPSPCSPTHWRARKARRGDLPSRAGAHSPGSSQTTDWLRLPAGSISSRCGSRARKRDTP